MKSQKNGHGNTQIAKDFFIYKRSPLKMQKNKKSRSPSRQLLETVNFTFMKLSILLL